MPIMRPNNAHTTPDQRFFFPINGEAEYHESFKSDELPVHERMPGEQSWIIFTNAQGESDIVVSRKHASPEITSGSTIDTIVTIGLGEQPANEAARIDLDMFAHRGVYKQEAVYDVRADDKLVVTSGFPHFKTLVLPASEPLPRVNDESVSFELMGIIQEDRLLTWPGVQGEGLTHVLDACIVNAQGNQLEKALLAGHWRDQSLPGTLSNYEAFGVYLQEYDQEHGTEYFPTEDIRPEPITDPAARERFFQVREIGFQMLYGELKP